MKVAEWCWSHLDSDYARGPFDSRAEAIEDAIGCAEAPTVSVGRVEWFDPARYVDTDLGSMLARMEERANDYDGWLTDDDPIAVRVRPDTGTDAAEQLALALQSWASEWLTGVAWHMADGPELLVLDQDSATAAPTVIAPPPPEHAG
jgi:hypothetical protein